MSKRPDKSQKCDAERVHANESESDVVRIAYSEILKRNDGDFSGLQDSALSFDGSLGNYDERGKSLATKVLVTKVQDEYGLSVSYILCLLYIPSNVCVGVCGCVCMHREYNNTMLEYACGTCDADDFVGI